MKLLKKYKYTILSCGILYSTMTLQPITKTDQVLPHDLITILNSYFQSNPTNFNYIDAIIHIKRISRPIIASCDKYLEKNINSINIPTEYNKDFYKILNISSDIDAQQIEEECIRRSPFNEEE